MRMMRRPPRTVRTIETMVTNRKMIFSVRERIAALLLAVHVDSCETRETSTSLPQGVNG
jgi:hypothetical protein